MVKIGLLGASAIAPQAMLDPASVLDTVVVAGVAARDAARAKVYAQSYGIAHVFPSYEALITSPDIDIVYNGLPPSLHAQWSIRALQAGKHVICEKPIAMNAQQARDMVGAAQASGMRLIEAFHSRYHPAFEHCLGWVRSGQIGDITHMDAHFGVGLVDDGHKNQYRPELGGGCMMDMGCYPLHWVSQMAGTEITDMQANATLASSGVDQNFEATLQFASGATARIASSMHPDFEFSSGLQITGTKGHIRFHMPLVPHMGGTLHCEVDGVIEHAPVSSVPTYCYQLRAILAAFQSGATLPTEGEAILTQQAGIDRLYASAGLGHLREVAGD